MPILFERVLGFIISIAMLALYYYLKFSATFFALLLFIPDISMIGYLKNPMLGARIYNIGHTYLFPAMILALSYFFKLGNGISVSIIWLAHIGMDRAFGFGLKSPTGFKDTHLGRIGSP